MQRRITPPWATTAIFLLPCAAHLSMTGFVRAMIDAMVSQRRVPDEAARVGNGLVRLAVRMKTSFMTGGSS